MRDIKTKHRLPNSNFMKGIEFLTVIIVLALLSSGCHLRGSLYWKKK